MAPIVRPNRHGRIFVALGLACALAIAPLPGGVARAETAEQVDARLDDLFGAHAPYRQFLTALQDAVAAGEREAVAGMVDYPLTTQIDGDRVAVDDEAAFLTHYDAIMTPKITDAIAAQTYATLFANAQGVMIGDGEVWFAGVGDDEMVKVIAINQ